MSSKWTPVNPINGWYHYEVLNLFKKSNQVELFAVCSRNIRIIICKEELKNKRKWRRGWDACRSQWIFLWTICILIFFSSKILEILTTWYDIRKNTLHKLPNIYFFEYATNLSNIFDFIPCYTSSDCYLPKKQESWYPSISFLPLTSYDMDFSDIHMEPYVWFCELNT